MVLLRKIFAAILAFFQVLLINLGVKKPDMKSTNVTPMSFEACDFEVSDKSETKLYKTIEYASSLKNQVQCVYADSERTAYIMTNSQMKLVHSLKAIEKTATLSTADGKIYAENTFKTFYTDSLGMKHYFEQSFNDGRFNTIRLGEYYYECHLRDMNSGRFKVDKGFHVFSDKLYAEYTLLADTAGKLPDSFGSEVKIPADSVASILVADKFGLHNSLDNVDPESVTFAAFDIAGAGVMGFIVPCDGSVKSLQVKKSGADYTVTMLADLSGYDGINKYDETGGYENYKICFGGRVYTDQTHSFDGIMQAAEEERNPLQITIEDDNADAEVIGYESLRGTYTIKLTGTSFQYAYDRPDLRYFAKVKISGAADDRKIMFRTTCDITGCLECGALLDENDLLMPVDVEVCKNFRGDGGDSKYSFNDYCYSDTFIPVYVEKNSETRFKVLNLYQNWGNYPLKQLSSIEFHISYYHLSTGTTESNCIAPYFVFDRDGWTLPDFRTASGNIWATQPQFNSVGILKFMTYRDKSVKNPVMSEFCGSRIDSYGPTYADVTNNYVSDCGSYTYSLRHIEFPQNDENRTYYTLNVEFNKDISFENFKRDFDLFYFDGRFVAFDKLGYLDENNKPVNTSVSADTTYHTLGNEAPYFGFYKINDTTEHWIDEAAGCNFALIIKSRDITVDGQKSDIPFALRESGNKDKTEGCLTLDAENVSFKKGDKIKLELILLPWGVGREDNDSTVLKVREDSVLKPLTAEGAENGGYIPTAKAVNNTAEITVKGGRGNNVIRVDGFTSIKKPTVYRLADGEWEEYELSSVHGYDGYMIRTNPDNTYSISFVYTAENPDDIYTFKICN